jgi:hypothetical protein
MKQFKIGQKVTVTKWEGESMCIRFTDLKTNKGVISDPLDDTENSYGVKFPDDGKWYIDAKYLKARK